MPSLASERRLLHIVVRPPWAGDALARALEACAPGDVLLLAQHAAPLASAVCALAPPLEAALRAAGPRVLAHDLGALGLSTDALREGVVAIDDTEWVALAAACRASVTWA